MTRKHFSALAKQLKHNRPMEHWDANKRLQWTMDAKGVAFVCSTFNPLFDQDKFLEACGGLFNV